MRRAGLTLDSAKEPPPSPNDAPWMETSQQALALATALRALDTGLPSDTRSTCAAYANVADEAHHAQG